MANRLKANQYVIFTGEPTTDKRVNGTLCKILRVYDEDLNCSCDDEDDEFCEHQADPEALHVVVVAPPPPLKRRDWEHKNIIGKAFLAESIYFKRRPRKLSQPKRAMILSLLEEVA